MLVFLPVGEGSTVVFIPGKVVYVKATFLRHPSMPRHRYAVSQTSLNHVEKLEGEYKEFCVSEKLSWKLGYLEKSATWLLIEC